MTAVVDLDAAIDLDAVWDQIRSYEQHRARLLRISRQLTAKMATTWPRMQVRA